MKKYDIIFGIIRLPMDFIMVLLALILAYFIRPHSDLIPGVHFPVIENQLPNLNYYLYFCIASSILFTFVASLNRLYSLNSNQKASQEFVSIVLSASNWLMAVIAYYFLIAHTLFFSRILLIQSFLLIIICTYFGRFLIRMIKELGLYYGYGRKKLIYIGYNHNIPAIHKVLKNKKSHQTLGLIDDKSSKKQSSLKILGNINQSKEVLAKLKPDEIICNEEVLSTDEIQTIMSYCQKHHIKYRFIPAISKLNLAHIDTDIIASTPIISISDTALSGWGRVIKRIIDILVSFSLLILLSPVFIIVSIIIKINDPGPVFYHSIRVGEKGNKVFKMLKFRSMYQDADKRKKELMDQNHRQGPLFKVKNDPRITKVGRWLRSTSIDELPQLWNVLVGQMSLVGPRGHLPDEVKRYEEHHFRVLAIKPGITGISQVNGRSDLDFEDEVKFDTYYIENWSLLLDLKILIKTFFVVLSRKGAD